MSSSEAATIVTLRVTDRANPGAAPDPEAIALFLQGHPLWKIEVITGTVHRRV